MKWMDRALQILAVLVIPLVLWGIRLEIANAVQNEKIASLEKAKEETDALKAGLATQNVALGRVEEKIDATNKRLDEIKDDLRRSLPPGP